MTIREISVVLAGTFLLAPVTLAGQPQQQSGSQADSLRLADFEKMALENNPTLKQSEAMVREAQGRLKQAGLYPNPTIGYNGDEISRGPIIRGGEHGIFIDQTIVLGGKLDKSRGVSAQALREAEAEAEVQRTRVLNSVRSLYYEAMGAERLVDLRQRTVQLADEAVKTSEGLYNVGASDKPDLLEVEIEAERAKLEFAAAQSHRTTVWRQLAALAGKPDLEPAPLAGDFDQSIPSLNLDTALEAILRDSPELKAARLGALRAQSAVALARSRRIPDIQARAGFRYNRELLEAGGQPVGWEAFADIGIQIPLFNRNQGNILAASSQASYADQEIRRLELTIRARFNQWFDRYKNSQRAVDAFRSAIIPRAEQAHRLYLEKFREMAAAYPQVLIAQRTLFQVEGQYISAVTDLWKAAIPLQGFLLTDGLSEPRPGVDMSRVRENLALNGLEP